MSFWANKLTNQPVQPTAPTTRELFPARVPYTPPAPQYQTVPVTEVYTPTVKLKQGSTCPGCGSGNYMGRVGNAAISCPDCGFHPLFEQSGYGERSLHTEPGQATPARQPAMSQTMKGAMAVLHSGYRDKNNSI